MTATKGDSSLDATKNFWGALETTAQTIHPGDKGRKHLATWWLLSPTDKVSPYEVLTLTHFEGVHS